MITKQEKKKLQKLLGYRYVAPIQKELELNKELGLNGKPFSNTMISLVINGLAHEVIEDAIWRTALKKKALVEKRKKILK